MISKLEVSYDIKPCERTMENLNHADAVFEDIVYSIKQEVRRRLPRCVEVVIIRDGVTRPLDLIKS